MGAGRQIILLLEMSLGGLRARRGPLLVVILGTACVVGVLIAMLSIGASFRLMGTKGTRADRLIVSTPGDQGSIKRDTARALSSLPGVKRNAAGKPLASGVAFGFAEGRKRLDGVRVMYGVRGVEAAFPEIIPELHLTDGRMFKPGLQEVIVGTARRAATVGLELGDHIRMRGTDWLVVGHYESVGYIDDGAMTDADTLMSALKSNSFGYVMVALDSPGALERFSRAVKADPTFSLNAQPEDQLLARQVKELTRLLDFISYFITSIMALGATVGAVNIMYMIVDQRRREIATLRAIGFASPAIVAAVLLESLLMALPGAALGAAIVWAMFNGRHVTPFGFSLNLTVTATVLAIGIGWALAMGLVGGLSPALRAARVPVAEALRAT